MRNGGGKRRPLPPIGKHIYAARVALRLTQAEFGKPLGVTERTVQRWELEWARPPSGAVARMIENVEKIDAAVGATLRAAVTGVDVERAGLGEAERRRVVLEVVVEMADVLDVAPRRAREALVRVAGKLAAAGLRVGDVVELLGGRVESR